ncbi:TolC family protein [Aurantiacibacter poecillastricola]|uniref:TolC family protein n=1 Tax=Aurantiacibacter poecillastricola TaxID=3064385 RepID=UPI00273FCBF3|nr:TolC family protein [Aurantiacibacter sp. 219JJ12-13]MDP5261401.1 TolC family protein [Aurantiacibacter sp. 219JJ12-13]
MTASLAAMAAGLHAQDIADGETPVDEDAPIGVRMNDEGAVTAYPQTYGPPATEAELVREPAPVAIPDPLDFAAAQAAATHPLVEAAEAEATALGSELRGARWLRYPSLSVEALAATEGSSFADEDGLALNAVVEQPIWSGGRIGGEIRRARSNLRSGQDRVDEAQRDIVLRVVQAYYNYVLATERYTVLEDSLVEHNQLLEAIGRRVDQQVSPRADLTLGQSRTAQVELDLASTEESRDSALVRLLELTGGIAVEPTLPPPGMAEILPPEEIALAEALACSPSLAALTDLIDVAEANKDIARAQLWPQVLLQLSQNEITGTRAAIVLRAQTGNGLSQLAAIDTSDARIQRALAEFGEAERTLREQLRRDYVLVRASLARIEAGVLAADAAAEIIDSYQRQFIAGRRSWLDVMNATREAANARLSETDARVTAAGGTARILALTCRWQPAGAVNGAVMDTVMGTGSGAVSGATEGIDE